MTDPRTTNRNAPQPSNSYHPGSGQDETTANNAPGKCIEASNVPSESQGLSAVQSHINCGHVPGQSRDNLQNASLEDDPNSDRRKRRRTSSSLEHDQDKHVNGIQNREIFQDPNVETFRHAREVQSPSADTSSGIGYTFGHGSEGHRSQDISAEKTSEVGNSATALPEAALSDSPNSEKKSPKKKVLKLNRNGKLLSSPPACRIEQKILNKPQNKRRSARKVKDAKLVIIKYGGAVASKENFGRLVDHILLGRRRHTSPRHHEGSETPSGPPKPTHPFFLKKAGQKAEQPTHVTNRIPIPATMSSEKAKVTNENLTTSADSREAVLPTTKSPAQFPRAHFPKYPDPVAPLWPPRDLVHVRDGAPGPFRDTPEPVLLRTRKDKGSVVRVSDSENVLLSELRRSCNIGPGARSPLEPADTVVLRIPKRHVASGPVLQKGMNSQLSHHTIVDPGSTHQTAHSDIPLKHTRRHPAVTKLYSSIPSTMSAFDTGAVDSLQWTQKYAPTRAEEVLQVGPEAVMLREWLKNLVISTVDTGRPGKDKQGKKRSETNKKAKRRKASDKLDGFIISSGDEASEMDEVSDPDEDELAGDVTVSFMRTVVRTGDIRPMSKSGDDKGRVLNAVLISGPSGCGKTASVYAVAKELDFEVFEINSGSRRNAKDILERVGDMTQNHLVSNLDTSREEGSGNECNEDIQPQELESIDSKQTTMSSFFESTPRETPNQHTQKKDKKNLDKKPEKILSSTPSRSQKQSLILLEEADILFEEDKQFWTGVMALISQSKRPIIITCNNEKLIPLQDLSLHAILRYRPPPLDLAADYLLLLAATEGHMLKREAVSDLYCASNQDLRKSMMELSFWCQMAVGSEKSGLDWILDRWPQGSDRDAHGDPLRVISLHTYQRCMGWFSRDILLGKNDFTRETELLHEGLNWWRLDLQDMPNIEESKFLAADGHRLSPGKQDAKSASFGLLQKAAQLADSQSVLDVLSRGWSFKQAEVSWRCCLPHDPY
jgi:sorting nexin-8